VYCGGAKGGGWRSGGPLGHHVGAEGRGKKGSPLLREELNEGVRGKQDAANGEADGLLVLD